MDLVEKALQRLTEAGMVSPSSLQGCSEYEVLQIEKKYDVKLPLHYRKFLLRMGINAGEFMKGSDFLFDRIFDLRGYAEDLLQSSNTSFVLSKHHFVFLVHQGYQFLFFDTLNSDDPPILHYLEDEPLPRKMFDHFSEWLLATVHDEIESMKDLKQENLSKS